MIELFDDIPDYRKGNAIRHKLKDILMIGLLTTICNGDDFDAMVVFSEVHEELLKSFLELPNGIPSVDTFKRVFSKINPNILKDIFDKWVDELKETIEGNSILVAIDGKTIRRSKDKKKKATHVVTAFATELQLIMGQISTDEKSNEITAIPQLLELFCQKDMIITIDAMGTQKDIAQKIIDKKADYVLALKGNQGNLFNNVKLYLETEILTQNKKTLTEQNFYAKTLEKGHGRVETRECFICPDINWLEEASSWAGISGIGVIVSKREIESQKASISYNYFIYSSKTATAQELLNIKRSHWAIENNLHWMLDVAFKEDDCRARHENAAENLNILRKQALQLMKRDTTSKNSKKSMQKKRLLCSYNILYALELLDVK